MGKGALFGVAGNPDRGSLFGDAGAFADARADFVDYRLVFSLERLAVFGERCPMTSLLIRGANILGQEVGDILMYLLLMCSELGIDMEQALLDKLADNERRFVR